MAHHARTFGVREAANDEDLLPTLHKAVLSLVKRGGEDLTIRQLGVFLTVYLEAGPHTVRGLSARFCICKPAVTRAINRLGELDLARRKADPRDRRSVLVQRTGAGWNLLEELRAATGQGAADAGWATAPRPGSRAWLKPVVTHRTGYGHGFAANTLVD